LACHFCIESPAAPVDIYTIIFAALAIVLWLRLLSVLGQRTGYEGPFSALRFNVFVAIIATVLCVVNYIAYEAKWYAAIKARIIILRPDRIVDDNTVIIGLLVSAMALLVGAAIALSFLHWKESKAKRVSVGRVIPFVRRSKLPSILGSAVLVAVAFAGTISFLNWRTQPAAAQPPAVAQNNVTILRPKPQMSRPIEVVDGDTVRQQGITYRLVGFDTPERGDRAQCDDERQRAEKATQRLSGLLSAGNVNLTRVACACRPGEEGTSRCNYGRLCGVLTVGGKDVGQILIGEGLAHPYLCGGTSCPRRQPWCDGR
jgi:endonuclease YncB( thermonuclease family)